MSKYILDMCKRWQVLYGADGYRFDLMGLIDQDTIKLVDAQGKAIDPSFMVYGEGWDMDTAIHHIFVQLCKIMHRFHKSVSLMISLETQCVEQIKMKQKVIYLEIRIK